MEAGKLLALGAGIAALVVFQRWYSSWTLQIGDLVRLTLQLNDDDEPRSLCVCGPGTNQFELRGTIAAVHAEDGSATVAWDNVRNLLQLNDDELARCGLPDRSQCQWAWSENPTLFAQTFPTRVRKSLLSRAF